MLIIIIMIIIVEAYIHIFDQGKMKCKKKDKNLELRGVILKLIIYKNTLTPLLSFFFG